MMKAYAKKLAPVVLSWAAMAVTAGYAQSSVASARQTMKIAGTWQGKLHVTGQDVRIVLKISQEANGGWRIVTYDIDRRGGGGMAAFAVTFQDGKLKYSVPTINASYAGQLSADGKSITGTWTQPSPLLLVLERATKEMAWEIPDATPVKLMAAGTDASFEVATIKPSDPNGAGGGRTFNATGRNFSTSRTTLTQLIVWAYGLQSRQLIGGPEWRNIDRYDIAATFPEGLGQPNVEQMHGMLVKLLAERFKLVFHREKREMQAYALTSKDSLKLVNTESTDADYSMRMGATPGGVMLLTKNATMFDFANFLQHGYVNYPVVDKTAITGKYDFVLKWVPEGPVPSDAPASNSEALPGLFEAIQEQLGLKLEAVRAPVDVLVIDYVARPSEN